MTRKGDVFSLGVTTLEMILGDDSSGVVSKKACAEKQGFGCTWQQGSTLISKHVGTMINNYKQQFPDVGGKINWTC